MTDTPSAPPSSNPEKSSLKVLLKAAETHIVTLQEDNAALRADLNNMIEAQALETEQMVQLSEQLWKLEEALMSTTAEKEVALMMLQNLKSNVDRIRSYAEETLSAAKTNKATRLSMAAKVYEIKSMVDTLDLKKKG